MGSRVTETFRPQFIGANATVGNLKAGKMGGFLAVTSGTLSAVDVDGNTVLSGIPVTAGVYTPMPFFFETPIFSFTTASGASGYLAI